MLLSQGGGGGGGLPAFMDPGGCEGRAPVLGDAERGLLGNGVAVPPGWDAGGPLFGGS